MNTQFELAEEAAMEVPAFAEAAQTIPGISAIVITKNEAHNLPACLATLNWVHEIIVVDAESKDSTIELAHEYTDKVFVRRWENFSSAKSFALAQCTSEWVLSIDADERVTPELREEICALLSSQPLYEGYEVPRLANFLGRWMMHGGWYPGYVLRLFRREHGGFNEVRVHEAVKIEGRIGRLRHHLLHYTDPIIQHYFEKFNSYTSLASEELHRQNKSFHLWDLLFRPLWFFFRMYILRTGFMDGLPGFILASFSAAYVFTKYAKLWELQKVKLELLDSNVIDNNR